MADLHQTPAQLRRGAVVARPAAQSFSLTARQSNADAERIKIALAERGIRTKRHPLRRSAAVAAGMSLTWERAGQAAVLLTDVKVALEFLDEIFADQPLHPADPAERAAHRALIDLGVKAQVRLEAVVGTRHQVQHDLAVHRLREVLQQADRMVADGGPSRRQFSNADAIWAPTLWRLRLLDREWPAFLLTGLPGLAIWTEWLQDRPSVAATLTPERGRVFLGDLARDGAYIAGTDHATGWDNILCFSRVLGAG